jgi:transposase
MLMAQDEGCFGRISMPRRCWAPAGVRPVVARQVVREYVYVYSAVAPALGRMTSLLLPRADTAMMNLFLAHVGQEFRDSFIVMQVDRAGWHDTDQLEVPENMRLILQPAYSPELHPVEHLWDHLRENYFHNWAAETLQQVIDVLIDGLEQLATDPRRLQSMTFFPHFRMIC